jgi:hypothetical protein
MRMAVEIRELYASPNGDRWYLARDVDLAQVFPARTQSPFRRAGGEH